MNPILATFHNAETGETVTRELTAEEINELRAGGWTETGKETSTASPETTESAPATDETPSET
jgi:hypothetical protein